MSSQSTAVQWERSATVEIRTTLHVTLTGSGPHPDMVDWETISLRLDEKIERDGHAPADLKVDYVSTCSETELW